MLLDLLSFARSCFFFLRALDAVLAVEHEGEGPGAGAAGPGSLASNTINNRNNNNNNNNNADDVFPSRMSLLEQKPSFDPSRDPVESGSAAIIESMMEPAAVPASTPMAVAAAQQDAHGRPSFDPNRESLIAAAIRTGGGPAPAAARGRGGMASAAGGGGVADVFVFGGGTGGSGASAGSGASGGSGVSSASGASGAASCVSREPSRGSRAVSRIFKSAPTRAPATGGNWEGGGVGEGPPQWSDGGRDSGGSVGTATTTTTSSGTVHWDASLTSSGATSTATTTTWGMPQTPPAEGGGRNSSELMSMSPPRSRVVSRALPTAVEEGGDGDVGQQPEVFTRPNLTRMASLLWLKEPKPERRPTM